METHRAAYRWTSEEMETALRRHLQTQISPGFWKGSGLVEHARYDKRVAWWGSVLIFLVVAGSLYVLRGQVRDGREPDFSLHVRLLVLSAWWIFELIRNMLRFRKARRAFGQTPGHDQMIEFELSSKEAKHWQRGLHYTAMSWRRFVLVAEATDGFLLYTDPRTYYWLPFRAFETPEARQDVRGFIQSSGVLFERIAS